MKIEAGKHPAALYARAFLNGEEIKNCKWADPEAGQLERYKTDATGKPLVNGDRYELEVLRGEVRIEMPEEHRHLLTMEFSA